MKAQALSAAGKVAMVSSGNLTIFEAQEEWDGGITPAKSIGLNTGSSKILRDFLIEQFPTPEMEKYKAVIGALEWIAQNAHSSEIVEIAAKALGWED